MNGVPRAALRRLRTRAGVVVGMGLLSVLAWTPRVDPTCRAPRAIHDEDGTLAGVACEAGEPADVDALVGPERLLFGRRLDLNASPPEVLEVLPRIGARRARALAAARPFDDIAALESIDGIGPKTARAVAAWSCVGECDRPLAPDWLERGGAR